MSTIQTTTDISESAGSAVTAYGISYAITSILSALLVVWKESTPAVHDALVAITGHHWVTHGVLDLIVFIVLGLIIGRTAMSAQMTGKSLVMTIVGATVVSGLIITGYFL